MQLVVGLAHDRMEVGAIGAVLRHLGARHQMHGVERTHFEWRSDVRSLAFDNVVGHTVAGHAMLPVVRTGEDIGVHGDVVFAGFTISGTRMPYCVGKNFVVVKMLWDI